MVRIATMICLLLALSTCTATESPSEILTFTGTGQQHTTETFELSAGTYLLEWSVSVNQACGYVFQLVASDHEEAISMGQGGSSPEGGSTTVALDGGRYRWSITTCNDWIVSVSPT